MSPPVKPQGFPIGLRVLVVDDDPLCLKIVEKMLKRCQYEVTTFSRGAEALKTLRDRKEDFDIVLSDVHMPDMDGFKLLEHIALELDIPVMMMSANCATDVVLRGIIHGAVDYLLKPVRIEELRNIWQHVVRRKRESSQGNLRDGAGANGRTVSGGSTGEGGGKDSKGSSELQGGSTKDNTGSAGGSGGSSKRKKGSSKNKDVSGEDENKDGSGGDENEDDSSALKKPRVVWSAELHQQFVTAVNQLGIDKAGPKRILDLMGVQGLTRENVASHLQKYRFYLKRLQGVNSGGER